MSKPKIGPQPLECSCCGEPRPKVRTAIGDFLGALPPQWSVHFKQDAHGNAEETITCSSACRWMSDLPASHWDRYEATLPSG